MNLSPRSAGRGRELAAVGLDESDSPRRRQHHSLFGDDVAGAAELGREIFQLRQAVPHRQYRLGVIDMNRGLEDERRNRRGEHVDEADRRMIGHQVSAAFRAVGALAQLRFGKLRDVLCSLRDPHRLGWWLIILCGWLQVAAAEPVVLFLKNGDRLTGEIVSQNEKRVVLKSTVAGRVPVIRELIEKITPLSVLTVDSPVPKLMP